MLREDVELVKRSVLKKLFHFKKIGGSHTAIFNLWGGLPDNLTRNKKGQKIIKEAIDELIKSEFLLSKPSTGEIHVSINPRKIKEVKELLGL